MAEKPNFTRDELEVIHIDLENRPLLVLRNAYDALKLRKGDPRRRASFLRLAHVVVFSPQTMAAGGGALAVFTMVSLLAQTAVMERANQEMAAANETSNKSLAAAETANKNNMTLADRTSRFHLLDTLYGVVECKTEDHEVPERTCPLKATSRAREVALVEYVELERRGGRQPDLRGVRFPGARFPDGIDLSGALLNGADFSRAELVSANLERATLTDVDLTSSDLRCARLDQALLDGTLMIGARVCGASLDISSSNAADGPRNDSRSFVGAVYNNETVFPKWLKTGHGGKLSVSTECKSENQLKWERQLRAIVNEAVVRGGGSGQRPGLGELVGVAGVATETLAGNQLRSAKRCEPRAPGATP